MKNSIASDLKPCSVTVQIHPGEGANDPMRAIAFVPVMTTDGKLANLASRLVDLPTQLHPKDFAAVLTAEVIHSLDVLSHSPHQSKGELFGCTPLVLDHLNPQPYDTPLAAEISLLSELPAIQRGSFPDRIDDAVAQAASITDTFSWSSPNELRVRRFMELAGQDVPLMPIEPADKVKTLRSSLQLEENMECIEKGLGVSVYLKNTKTGERIRITEDDDHEFEYEVERPFDLKEVIDGVADAHVVAIGTSIACGIRMGAIQLTVDYNNLLKFGPGGRVATEGPKKGKWLKPENHPAPDIMGHLVKQGYAGATPKPVVVESTTPPIAGAPAQDLSAVPAMIAEVVKDISAEVATSTREQLIAEAIARVDRDLAAANTIAAPAPSTLSPADQAAADAKAHDEFMRETEGLPQKVFTAATPGPGTVSHSTWPYDAEEQVIKINDRLVATMTGPHLQLGDEVKVKGIDFTSGKPVLSLDRVGTYSRAIPSTLTLPVLVGTNKSLKLLARADG